MLNQTGWNGYAASEFPLTYFISGKLYSVFGFHEAVFRCVNLFFFFTGLLFLYGLGRVLSRNTIASLLPVIIIGTSPCYMYYGAHFLPNVPAISMCLAGWYFFFRYLKNKKSIWIYCTALFFCLAGLFKVSELLSFFAAGMYLCILWLRKPHTLSHRDMLHIGISGGIALLLVAIWVKYTLWFNGLYGNDYSLTSILPIWNLNRDQVADIIDRFYTSWSLHIFSPAVWILTGLSALLFALRFKAMHPALRSITLLLFLGSAMYLLLFFEQLYHHDYYLLTPLIAIVFLILSISEFLMRNVFRFRGNLKPAIAIFCTLVLMAWCLQYNHKIQYHRLNDAAYKTVGDSYYSLQPYLRSIGITPSDKIISVPDRSANISLYLFNNPGWTEMYSVKNIAIRDKITLGAKYLVIGDSSYLHKAEYEPYLGREIGHYKNFIIFDLQ